MSASRRVIIVGAAGKDFHTFNTFYRGRTEFEVVAFTATQIPGIAERTYPPELAGPGYAEGIPIHAEAELEELIRSKQVRRVVFAYSDVTHEHVMHIASRVGAAGAEFVLHAPEQTQVKASVPVVSVCAVRTGCGKSQATRRVAEVLKGRGKRVVVLRHPMPYGDLAKQAVQRFGSLEDMDRHETTIEEREEYEQHVNAGTTVYAGVDYEAITREAENEADILIWDGGNNDIPLLKSDLEIVLVDPHRVGHELRYYPGETNVRRADVIIANKVDSADPAKLERLLKTVKAVNPNATLIRAASPITIADGPDLRGKRVLAVEDGPTLTHGEMKYGAGVLAARQVGAELIDPREYAVGSIAETFRSYPGIGTLLPAMGYGDQQVRDLEATIRAVPCDEVLIATPMDLGLLIDVDKPLRRVSYELREEGSPTLDDVLAQLA